MSEPITPQKKTSAWTEAESNAFLQAVIEQLLGRGTKIMIDFTTIVIPGRTPRALQERWLVVRKAASASGIVGSGPVGTPQKRAARGKVDEDGLDKSATKKRKRAVKAEEKKDISLDVQGAASA